MTKNNDKEIADILAQFAIGGFKIDAANIARERIDKLIQQAIAEHEAGKWQSFGKKIPYGYAKIMVIFPPEAKQEANIVTYDPDADDYQDGDIWAYVTDLFPEPYQEGGER